MQSSNANKRDPPTINPIQPKSMNTESARIIAITAIKPKLIGHSAHNKRLSAANVIGNRSRSQEPRAGRNTNVPSKILIAHSFLAALRNVREEKKMGGISAALTRREYEGGHLCARRDCTTLQLRCFTFNPCCPD